MLIDAERQARQEVLNAEKHRDDISKPAHISVLTVFTKILHQCIC